MVRCHCASWLALDFCFLHVPPPAGANSSMDVANAQITAVRAEQSLDKLDPFVESIHARIRRADSEILAAVQRQSVSGGRARAELHAAQIAAAETLNKVAEIRRKAAQSEAMVQDICRDVKRLDYAKRHLTVTITALRRLAMLVAAVDRLQLAAERREFDEAAHLLGAVQQLAAHFTAYAHVPRIAEMRGRVATLEQSLRSAALREFELLGEDQPAPALVDRLRDCAVLADALGPAARDELIDAYCRREMGIYTQIFGTVGETARLDRIVNRYKWLIRRLDARRDVLALFPRDWRVPQLLCVTFCSITKTVLAEILDERAAQLPHHVDDLLKAMEATTIFETEMARRFGGGGPRGPRQARNAGADEANDHETGWHDEDGMANSAAVIRQKYERELAERSVSEPGRDAGRDAARQHAAAEAVARASFQGAISAVFAPYLHLYVDRVGRDLLGNVDTWIANETWHPLSQEQRVLKSANHLTDAVRGEMRDCSMKIGRGTVLRDLAANAFCRAYGCYADRLHARLPKTAAGGTSGVANLGTTDWQIKVSDDEFEVLGLILSTAEHCVEMLDQLARALAARLEPSSLAESIDFGEEEDSFRTLAMQCTSVMLLGVETRLEAPLGMLVRHNWSAIEAVGDQSPWAAAAGSLLAGVGPHLARALPPNHFRFFCDKLARSLGGRLLDAVYRCSAVSEMGCQQLRLDVEALKGSLVGVAKAGAAIMPSEHGSWVSTYSAEVAMQMAEVESMLKVVSSPIEALVDAFLELLPDATPTDLQRIADVKGLRRTDLVAALEQYNSRRRGREMHVPAAAVAGRNEESIQEPYTAGNFSRGVKVGPKGSSMGEVAARFRLPPAATAQAKASAAAEGMRETMGRTLGAMKSLRFMHSRGGSRGEQGD
jgi:vacuolar protein sorting-associated protein 53